MKYVNCHTLRFFGKMQKKGGITMYCKNCDTPNSDSAKVCASCGAPLPPPVSTSYNPTENVTVPDYPMKWFHFMIYFQLFAAAVINLIDGILYIAGINTSLGILCLPFGIFGIAMCAYLIYIRFALAGYKKNGLTHYKIYLILITISQTLTSLLSGGFSAGIGSLIGNIIYITLITIYFNKRQELFIY